MASLVKIPVGTCLGGENNNHAFSICNLSKAYSLSDLCTTGQISIPACSQLSVQGKKQLHAVKRNEKRLFCRNDDGSFEIAPEGLLPYSIFNLIRDFYGAINAKDVQKLNHVLAQDCLFMDLIFYMPFGGRQSIINFLCDVMDAMGPNICFAVDSVTEQDGHTATVTWHLEWKGKELPFTTACTFFQCELFEGKLFIRKIIGLEELPVKPGELVLKLLKATGSLFDSFPIAAYGLLQKVQGNGGGLQTLLDLLTGNRKRSP